MTTTTQIQTRADRLRASASTWVLTLSAAAALSGCAAFPIMSTAPVRQHDAALIDQSQASPEQGSATKPLPSGSATVTRLPGGPASPRRPQAPMATPAEIARIVPIGTVDATLPPQPVPQFINAVFGDVLHVPYAIGPDVSTRTEIITLRSSPHMSQRDFAVLVADTLKDYGLVVSAEGTGFRIDEAGGEPSEEQLVLRSRSSADTPSTSRPVTQFVQLYSVEASTMQPLVQDLFPAARSVKITPQPVGNYLVVSGSGRDVAAAVGMISTLDQPRFAGAQVARIEPTYWRAEAFAKALSDAMTTEGYMVSNSPSQPRGVMILPLATVNQVLAFAGDPAVMARLQFWAQEIDKPSAVGEQKSTFVYVVKNTDAASLGALARGQSPQTFTPSPPVGVGNPGSPPISIQSGQSQTPPQQQVTNPNFGEANDNSSGQLPGGGSIVVDTIGNRVLFTGSATQFSQLRQLLSELDTAPRQVLIEVTVAEVTLTDETELGLEFFFNNSGTSQSLSGGTKGGLSIGSSGLVLNYSKANLFGIQNLQAQFNAFASNSNVNVLSKPRIVAKSGSDAQIQVGTDIPIISAQTGASTSTGGTTDLLQSVEYRQTGVILKVKPTIYGPNLVDLQISQEVSKSLGTSSGDISSPPIQDRSIATELSLQDGATAVLGGLIDNTYTKANNGIPYLKDIPILGTLFRTDTINGDRDELVVLVTPHILRDTEEMNAVADSLTHEVNRAYKVGVGWSYTLSPYATGFNIGPGPSAKPREPDISKVINDVRASHPADQPSPAQDPSAPPPPPPPQTIPSPKG